jgi:purine-cytosine permease-like protein
LFSCRVLTIKTKLLILDGGLRFDNLFPPNPQEQQLFLHYSAWLSGLFVRACAGITTIFFINLFFQAHPRVDVGLIAFYFCETTITPLTKERRIITQEG